MQDGGQTLRSLRRNQLLQLQSLFPQSSSGELNYLIFDGISNILCKSRHVFNVRQFIVAFVLRSKNVRETHFHSTFSCCSIINVRCFLFADDKETVFRMQTQRDLRSDAQNQTEMPSLSLSAMHQGRNGPGSRLIR